MLEFLSSTFDLTALKNLEKDGFLLLLSKSFRLFSFGFLSVILVIYLSSLELSYHQIGSLLTLTMIGDALLSLFLTSKADRFGRRKTLILGSIISCTTSLIFASTSNYYVLLIAGVLGVISPSGSEVGPFMAVELSALAQIVPENERTRILAWYNLVGSFSQAMGGLFCGSMITILQNPYILGMSFRGACQVMLVIYSFFQALIAFSAMPLSEKIEHSIDPLDGIEMKSTSAGNIKNDNNDIDIHSVNRRLSMFGIEKAFANVLKMSLLFLLDSFAGSFILQSLITNWFHDTYHTSSHLLGIIVFLCNTISAISALFAAQIASVLGLVLTMVVTHIPSSVLVILVPLMPTEFWAIVILCLRFSISQMDVPLRNSFIQSMVSSDERSAANGILNVTRTLGTAMGPLFASPLYARTETRNFPFFIAGVLTIMYDIMLLFTFHYGGKNNTGKNVSERYSGVVYSQVQAQELSVDKNMVVDIHDDSDLEHE